MANDPRAAPIPVPVTDCARCPLRQTGAFSTNTPEEIAFIARFKQDEVLRTRGSLLIAEGRPNGQLYTLLSGWAFRFRSLGDGRRQILNFLLPGDLIGLQEKLGVDTLSGVELLADARLCCFPMDQLWDLYRHYPSLAYDITWLAAHEEHIVDDNLVSVGQRSAAQRLAMLLVHLYRRADSIGLRDAAGAVPFPLSQQHMSDALGLSLVHTNKTLRRLARAGLYDLQDGRLRLPDPKALQDIADYRVQPLHGRPLI